MAISRRHLIEPTNIHNYPMLPDGLLVNLHRTPYYEDWEGERSWLSRPLHLAFLMKFIERLIDNLTIPFTQRVDLLCHFRSVHGVPIAIEGNRHPILLW